MPSNQCCHLAIIMDGNRRYAKAKGLSVNQGHADGARNIEKIVLASIKQNIKYLSLFAFSIENWKRTKSEITFLMNLFASYFKQSDQLINWCHQHNICLKWLGFESNLNDKLLNQIKQVTTATKNNNGLVLTIAFNYGGMQDILQAAIKTNSNDDIKAFKNNLLTSFLPPVDLLIRTGNETRISNFLLFDLAYAEIAFVKKYWPEFSSNDLKRCLKDFSNKKRRYGV